jgi:hypothetical protein
MTIGPESQWLKNEFRVAKKKNTVITTGTVKITTGKEIGYDGSEINTIRFKACQDGRTIRTKTDDDPPRPSFRWELDEVEMHRSSDNSVKKGWLTYGQTARKHNPNKSCAFS